MERTTYISLLAAWSFWLCVAPVGGMQAAPLVPSAATPDSAALVLAFQKASRSKRFMQHAWLRSGMHFTLSEPTEFIIGDLNGDGAPDALVRFNVEGRNGGNNWDLHYAAFLKKGTEWDYTAMLDAGSSTRDGSLLHVSIVDGSVHGTWLPAEGSTGMAYATQYRLKGSSFINVYTALHRVEQEGGEWLGMLGIVVTGKEEVPLVGTVKAYQTILGPGQLDTDDPQPECGTWFEEGVIRQLSYPQLQFEVNDKGKAAWMSAHFGDGNIRLQTLYGTITDTTTLENLTALFKSTGSYMLLAREDGGTDFAMPDGQEVDSQLRFTFNAAGKLVAAYRFIPC